MKTTTFGWLILLFPLVGTIVIGLGYKVLGQASGWVASLAIALAFAERHGRAQATLEPIASGQASTP